ncbi:RNA polymerase sigma24 factor [Nocardioides flavus (ex Wang et al. 2016)]|uniref:RNA polymerase sigma24 factor n=1 Tax=Nocardioides flavus (ex Wang et al. 2016) TaxID=2058780 RepID=A0ABQ3HNS2_9ACTN|nr:sigma-70 family RNA polymerase sigma factor [Nocardioides flavus (ex Wang et al. 2016)]GHE17779.1 RNA polymerase sigma24 factor [Nocardioides flavus (ex Wang et al. 2016)]
MDVLRRRPDAEDDGAESFAWFFTAEYPQVVRLLRVVLGDPASAEDVAQEAFVRLHRHWDRVVHYESPEAWVRRVALNQAFSWRRREQRRRERESRAPAWGTAAETGAAGAEEADAVLRAVRRLPARDRALVGLYHLEDRPLDEVASVLGISPHAAKVALHRARRRLAGLLNEEEVAR